MTAYDGHAVGPGEQPLPDIYGPGVGNGTASPHGADRRALEFPEILRRAPRNNIGWSLLGVAFLLLAIVIAQTAVEIPFFVVDILRGRAYQDVANELGGKGTATPAFLATVNLGWAVAIPCAWLTVWVVHGLKPRWIESVLPRLRWRWLAWCLGTAAVALIATVVVSAPLPGGDGGGSGSVSGGVNDFTATSLQFLLVILILTPLQAAGEEHIFRGYLTQATGSLFGNRIVSRTVAIVFPAFVFALAHGLGQGLEIFVDRFAFGLGAGALVVLTGGLEAGIAMHVLNNFLAFGAALFFGDMTQALHATGGSWWGLIGTAVQIGVWLGLTVPLARRLGVRTRTEPLGGSGVDEGNGLVPHPRPV